MSIFANPYLKAYEEESSIKNQGPKTHQEDRSAKKV